MRFRKLNMKDAPRMLEWLNHPDQNRYFLFDTKGMTLEKANQFIANAQDGAVNQHFAVTDNQDCYMGTVSLKNIDYVNRNAEYAIALHMDAQGKGYAKYATDSILQVAFGNLWLHRVYLNVLSANIRAIKFYQKYGFRLEGEFHEHIQRGNEFCNLVWYRLLHSEFPVNGTGGGGTFPD